jgi:hypothetical protein
MKKNLEILADNGEQLSKHNFTIDYESFLADRFEPDHDALPRHKILHRIVRLNGEIFSHLTSKITAENNLAALIDEEKNISDYFSLHLRNNLVSLLGGILTEINLLDIKDKREVKEIFLRKLKQDGIYLKKRTKLEKRGTAVGNKNRKIKIKKDLISNIENYIRDYAYTEGNPPTQEAVSEHFKFGCVNSLKRRRKALGDDRTWKTLVNDSLQQS